MGVPKYCAICGRIISHYDLCKSCREKYGSDTPWVKALIVIESRNYYIDRVASEFTITDLEDEFVDSYDNNPDL